jgi:hypothetical protein
MDTSMTPSKTRTPTQTPYFVSLPNSSTRIWTPYQSRTKRRSSVTSPSKTDSCSRQCNSEIGYCLPNLSFPTSRNTHIRTTQISVISFSPSNLTQPRLGGPPGGPAPFDATRDQILLMCNTDSPRSWWETATRAPALL